MRRMLLIPTHTHHTEEEAEAEAVDAEVTLEAAEGSIITLTELLKSTKIPSQLKLILIQIK